VARVIGRDAELVSATALLNLVSSGPCALLLEGEAGIGKTTVWQEIVSQAAARDFRVLTARPAEAEAKLSFGALADLLGEVDGRILAELPAPQRTR
jgi:predicted ATPase